MNLKMIPYHRRYTTFTMQESSRGTDARVFVTKYTARNMGVVNFLSHSDFRLYSTIPEQNCPKDPTSSATPL